MLLLVLLPAFCFAGEGNFKKLRKVTSSDTLRIHPIGDSITRGKDGDTYRYYLKKKIRNEMYLEIDFVGSCPHAPDSYAIWDDYPAMADSLEGDIEHDGWGGIKIGELTNSSTNSSYPVFTIEELVMDYPADIILLMIGTNDAWNGTQWYAVSARYDTLVTRILRSTDAHLIVSTIPPTSSIMPAYDEIQELNEKIDYIVNTHIEAGENISFINNYARLGTGDLLNDLCHLNSSGDKKVADGFYEAIDRVVTGIHDDSKKSQVPSGYKLHQNYPNPFNSDTTIEFYIPSSSYVNLKIYNVLGEEVMTCVSGKQNAGDYSYHLSGDNLATGLYVYKLLVDNYVGSKKLILLK